MNWKERVPLKKSLLIIGIYSIIIAAMSLWIISSFSIVQDENISMSISQYKKILEKNPNDPETHARLAWIYYQTEGDIQENPYIKRAEEEYRRAIELAPKNVEYRYYLALVLEELGEVEKAKGEYKEIIRQSPDHILATYNLAVIYWRSRNFQEAEKLYKHLIELEPTAGNVYFELGKIYDEMQDRENAMVMYKQALQYIPELTEATRRVQELSNQGK